MKKDKATDPAKQEEPYVIINDIAKLFSLFVAKDTQRAGTAYGYRKLLMCLAHGEEMPQLDLIGQVNLTPATVSSSMAKLEGDGIVARRFDPADRRKYYVKLTDKGKRHCRMIQERSDELGEIMLEGISEEEKQQLSRLLGIMLSNLKEKGDKAVEADKIS